MFISRGHLFIGRKEAKLARQRGITKSIESSLFVPPLPKQIVHERLRAALKEKQSLRSRAYASTVVTTPEAITRRSNKFTIDTKRTLGFAKDSIITELSSRETKR